MIKRLFTFSGLLLMCLQILAQNAQNEITLDPTSRQRIINYQEQIYLHTNTSFLLTGESIYFKAYCLESSSLIPSTFSEIAYIDLIDEKGKSVLKTKVKLENGTGYGDFFIPSSLRSGNYLLVAYTNWMKNFDDHKFFTTPIYVVNPFIRLPDESDSLKQATEINIYPEGGKLIDGVENEVAIELKGFEEGGAQLNGKLVDDAGNTIEVFKTQKNGIGRVSFTCDGDRVYKVIITDSQKEFHFKTLPQPVSKGFGLSLRPNDDVVVVQAYKRGEGYYYTQANLLIHTASQKIKAYPLKFKSDAEEVEVPVSKLPAGVVFFTLTDVEDKVVGQRAYFNINDNLSQKDVIDIQLNDRKSYGNREKVAVRLESSADALASVSVRKVEDLIDEPTNTSVSYSYLDYPSNGSIQHSSMYFNEGALNTDIDLDNLMLTLNTDIKNLQQKNDKDNVQYLPDVRGDLISGALLNKSTGEPMPEQTVYLSIPSRNYGFYTSETDENGRFYFNVKKFIGENKVIIQANTQENYEIVLDEEFKRLYENFEIPEFHIDSAFKSIIKERSIHTQIENAYYEVKSDSIIPSDSGRFFGSPDVVYLLDDYTRFPTMEDVLREYVPEVLVRSHHDQYIFKMIDFTKNNNVFQENPLMLIDGVPVFNPNDIIDYNPLNVERLEAKCRRYFYGPRNCAGIISFQTYNGDLAGFIFDDHMYQKDMVGIQPDKIYFSPDYSSPRSFSNTPDYRHQLYWDPEVNLTASTSKDLSFYTSDVNGKYEIRIEGVTKDGQPFSKRLLFEVGSTLP